MLPDEDLAVQDGAERELVEDPDDRAVKLLVVLARDLLVEGVVSVAALWVPQRPSLSVVQTRRGARITAQDESVRRTVLVVAAVDRHHTRRVGQRERKHHQQHLAAEVATIDEVPVEDVPVRLCRPALRKLTESESLAAFGTAVYLHLGAREVFGVARLVRENVQQVRQLPVRVTNDRHAAVRRYLYHGATRQRMKVGRSLRHQPMARPITSAPPGATSHVWSGETCAGTAGPDDPPT